MSFRQIAPAEFTGNVFNMVGSDWMLVGVQSGDKFNVMTASWGGMGVLWNKNVAFVFIRPQRYTYGLVEQCDRLTLSFFGGDYREALRLCGTKSGRDCDKPALAHLTPFQVNDGCTALREASVIMECTKLYAQTLDEKCIIADGIRDNYRAGDYHKMYVVSIDRILAK